MHGGAHVGQVGIHLAVCKPENGDPEKDGASSESTADLVYPGVVEIVPLGGRGTEGGGLDCVPHLTIVPAAISLDGVDAESATKSLEEELKGRSHDISARRSKNVKFLAVKEDRESDDEHYSGDEIREPEADIALSVDHANLTNKGTNVDEEVKVIVDAGHGDGRVDNDALSLDSLYAHLFLRNLLGNEGRNVGLKSTSTGTHDQDSENKDAERSAGLVEDRGSRRSNEDNVTDFSNNDRVENRLEATEVGIGDPGSKEGADVDPKGVESGEGKGNLLAHVERTGNGFGIIGVQGSTSGSRPGLGNEVAVDGNGSIIGHALNQLDKRNSVDAPWNRCRHTAKGAQLLLSGEVGSTVTVANVAVLKASLALAELVGGGTSVVKLGVLALRITRAVNKGGVKARYTLSSVSRLQVRMGVDAYDFVRVSYRHDGGELDTGNG